MREIQVEGKSFSDFTEGQHFKTLQFPLREMMLSQRWILLTIQFQGFLLLEIQQGSELITPYSFKVSCVTCCY